MSKVDKNQLHTALDALTDGGAIRGWQSRPLGMYMIFTLDGEVMRPDTKETAMWVMGAMYGIAVSSAASEMQTADDAAQRVEAVRDSTRPPGLTKSQDAGTAALLDRLQDESHAILGWERDADGDFVLHLATGERRAYYARDALVLATGIELQLTAYKAHIDTILGEIGEI